MGDLLSALARRVDANARNEVRAYIREFPEYRTEAAQPSARAEMLEYAVWSRRRTVELVRNNQPLSDADLAFIAAIGEKRARRGLSIATAGQVLALHANLMLREIHEVASHDHLADLLRLTAWFGAQGARGTVAFTQGHQNGLRHSLPVVRRVRMLTDLLLANDPAAADLAAGLGMRIPERCLVAAIWISGRPRGSEDAIEAVVEDVFRRHRMPVTERQPGELVALISGAGNESLWCPGEAGDRVLPIVRDLVAMVGRPCQVGTAMGRVGALTDALELARRVATVAPVEQVPRRLYGVADVFVELSVAQVPEVDSTLRDLARRLTTGPDLVTTLDAYYRNNMNRVGTAAAVHIHPRTLDYRLRRARELTGVDPTSVHGVRILSATVTRALSGAWN